MRKFVVAWFRAFAIAVVLASGTAVAETDFAYLSRFLFVAAEGRSEVAIIDIDTDKVVDTFDVGLAPRGIEISAKLKTIVAIDGRTPRVAAYSLVQGSRSIIDLDFTPQRLLVAAGGLRIAALDFTTGDVALIELAGLRMTARLRLGAINDAMFDGSWEILRVASADQSGIASFDARTGAAKPAIPGSSTTPYSVLARSPDGREVFARAGGAIDVVDVVHDRVSASLKSSGQGIYPSGAGRYLLSPDSADRRLSVATLDPVTIVGTSSITPETNVFHSVWFDTAAFGMGAKSRDLLIYDMEARKAAGVIDLGALPGRSVVSPDGAKLFVPLPETGEVVVVDARYRKRSASIRIPGRPFAAIMAGAYGICH